MLWDLLDCFIFVTNKPALYSIFSKGNDLLKECYRFTTFVCFK